MNTRNFKGVDQAGDAKRVPVIVRIGVGRVITLAAAIKIKIAGAEQEAVLVKNFSHGDSVGVIAVAGKGSVKHGDSFDVGTHVPRADTIVVTLVVAAVQNGGGKSGGGSIAIVGQAPVPDVQCMVLVIGGVYHARQRRKVQQEHDIAGITQAHGVSWFRSGGQRMVRHILHGCQQACRRFQQISLINRIGDDTMKVAIAGTRAVFKKVSAPIPAGVVGVSVGVAVAGVVFGDIRLHVADVISSSQRGGFEISGVPKCLFAR